MAKKLSFLPLVRPLRKHRAGKQNFTLGKLVQFLEIPTLFCPIGLNDGLQNFLIGQWT